MCEHCILAYSDLQSKKKHVFWIYSNADKTEECHICDNLLKSKRDLVDHISKNITTFSYGRFGYPGGFPGPGRPRTVRIRGSPFLPYRYRHDCVRGNSNLYESAPLSPAHFFLRSVRVPPRICWTHLDQIREHKGQPYHHRRRRRGSSSGNLILYKRKYVHLRRLNWRPRNFSTR